MITSLKRLSLKEGSGFVLENLMAKQATVSPRKLELFNMSLITPYSNLGDTLVMKFRKYPDFRDFPNKVNMNGQFKKAFIAIRDIMAFAPALERNTFFAQNKNEIIYIDGQLRGRVNNLKGRNLNLRLGRSMSLKGNFNSRNPGRQQRCNEDADVDKERCPHHLCRPLETNNEIYSRRLSRPASAFIRPIYAVRAWDSSHKNGILQ